MFEPMQKRSKKAGMSPGTLMYVGKPRTEETRLTIIHYNESHLEEKESKNCWKAIIVEK